MPGGAPRNTYHPVSIRLKGLVDWIYVYRSDWPQAVSLGGAVLPQLYWPLEGRFSWRSASGAVEAASGAGVMGPSSGAVRVESRGPTTIVGVGLFPEGWAALMPCPADRLADDMTDLRQFWGDDARDLDAGPDLSDGEIAAVLNARLVERLGRCARPVDPRTSLIAAWANGERADIDRLTAALDVSHRHVDRLCRTAFGIGPRRLANKHRTLRIAAGLAAGLFPDRRDAWTQGWFDQSHFIRSFRHFIGTTPGAFLDEPDLFVAEVMRARVRIASDHPLGLFVR